AYGVTLIIDHGRGITTRYAHLQKYVAQKKQKISRGQLIGYVGNTGRSTGPHLHYEVRLNNAPVNPEKYILN
ncbi:MAG: M23 family metallopeptidase, partial [Desulfonatronovibrio sp.]